MVGNDVVDLFDPAVVAGPRHPRFDARVFAPSEHRALRESAEPNPLRWVFWAAKEAAYKVAKKLDAAAVWSPLRFVVCFERGLEGAVEYKGLRIPVQVERDAERVHALATDQVESFARLRSCVARLESPAADASAAVRLLAREQLAPLLGARVEQLEIARRGRIPVLRSAGHDAPFDLSLSHHGRFVAFAAEPWCERSPR
jgi:phosphopantetheinyl transferase (holo-ACP synthase)